MRSRTASASGGVAGTSSSSPSRTSARSSSVIRLPQSLERTRGARLDSAARNVEYLRGFLLREADEVAQRDDRALVVRQRVDGSEQRVAALGVHESRLGGRGRAPRGVFGGGAQRDVGAASGGTAPVVRLVGDDAKQPGPERCTCAEAAERAPRFDERILRRVLRVGRGARQKVRRAKCDPLVCVHELRVRLLVAPAGALDQQVFVEWTALHFAGPTPGTRLEFQWLARWASTTSRSRSGISGRRSRGGNGSSARSSYAAAAPGWRSSTSAISSSHSRGAAGRRRTTRATSASSWTTRKRCGNAHAKWARPSARRAESSAYATRGETSSRSSTTATCSSRRRPKSRARWASRPRSPSAPGASYARRSGVKRGSDPEGLTLEEAPNEVRVRPSGSDPFSLRLFAAALGADKHDRAARADTHTHR